MRWVLTFDQPMPGERSHTVAVGDHPIIGSDVTMPLGGLPANLHKNEVYAFEDHGDAGSLVAKRFGVLLEENVAKHEARQRGRYIVRAADGSDQVVRISRPLTPDERALFMSALDDDSIRAEIRAILKAERKTG